MVFQDGKWSVTDDFMKLTKYDAVVWLTLFFLMTDPECRRRYVYDDYRREAVQKVSLFSVLILASHPLYSFGDIFMKYCLIRYQVLQ